MARAMKPLPPNSYETVGDLIPAGGFELGVAWHRGGYTPIAILPDSRPIRLATSTATFTAAEAKLRLILRGVRLAEEGR